MFYHGSLEDAVKEACLRPAKEVSLLLNSLFELEYQYLCQFN